MGHCFSHGHGHHHHSHGASKPGEQDPALKPVAVAGGLLQLTAHLSAKDGNELDVFVQTAARTPLAIHMATVAAVVRVGSVEMRVVFEPAPADERPAGELDGCSHFVAKTPFMAKDVPANVSMSVVMAAGAEEVAAEWIEFVPQKFAHHHD